MEKMKTLLKYQKEIIEGLFVCLIGGWAFSSIISGSFKEITNLQYCGEVSFVRTMIILILCSAAMGILYFMHDHIARLVMFVLVYCYLILCAYNGYEVQWGATLRNPIGLACFSGVLCLVAVLTFLYVREDIFGVLNKVKISKKTANIIVVVIGVLLFAFVGGVTVLRYLTYSNSTFDFGIFAQMYEYMKQTGSMNTTVEKNVLFSHCGRHFSPIFYVMLPVYSIFSSPVTVQLIQAFMVALPVIPIVLLCRHYKLSNWMTVALSLLYVLYPATAGGTFYDIHENCFLTFVLLMSIWAIEKNRKILIILFVLLTFLVKEDTAIYVLTLGAYCLFSKRFKKKGIILMVVSAAYFALALYLVDAFGHGTAMDINSSLFGNLQFDSDGSMIQIIRTIIANPAYVLGQVVTNSSAEAMDKIEYFIYMIVPIAPVVFMTGKKYSRYILLAPFLVMNVITTYVYLHNIGFQYNFGTIALVMYLIIINLSEVKVKEGNTRICISVICASVMFTSAICPKLEHYGNMYSDNKAVYKQLDNAINTIPKDASVCASGFLVPHFSKNLELYDQNHLETEIYTDYLVVDERYSSEKEKFNNILASGQYESVYSVPEVIQIYRKK